MNPALKNIRVRKIGRGYYEVILPEAKAKLGAIEEFQGRWWFFSRVEHPINRQGPFPTMAASARGFDQHVETAGLKRLVVRDIIPRS